MEHTWFIGSDENYWKVVNIMDRHIKMREPKRKVGLWKRK